MNEYKFSFADIMKYDFDKNSSQNTTKFKTSMIHLLS